MASKTVIKKRLEFWEKKYEKLQAAYLALVEGGVKSYTIDDRDLTRLDLPELDKEILEAENKIDELTALLDGKKSRKAFGILPMDW